MPPKHSHAQPDAAPPKVVTLPYVVPAPGVGPARQDPTERPPTPARDDKTEIEVVVTLVALVDKLAAAIVRTSSDRDLAAALTRASSYREALDALQAWGERRESDAAPAAPEPDGDADAAAVRLLWSHVYLGCVSRGMSSVAAAERAREALIMYGRFGARAIDLHALTMADALRALGLPADQQSERGARRRLNTLDHGDPNDR